MFKHLTDILTAWGPAGILLLSILDSSGFPVAGVFDFLLILTAVKAPAVGWLCAALAVAGSTTGNCILFFAARKGGDKFIGNTTTSARNRRFRDWFAQYGMITVFIPALMPIPMPLKLFVISAGIMGTPVRTFLSVVLAARILRYFGEVWLGIQMGEQSATYLKTHVWGLVGAAAALFIVLYLFILWRGRQQTAPGEPI